MEILPATTVADVTTGFLAVVSDNIAPVLGILAFTWGVYFVTARINKAKNGKI